jgi:hypothetical protein
MGRRLPYLAKESQGPELLGNKEPTLPSLAQDQVLQSNKEHMPPSRPPRVSEL